MMPYPCDPIAPARCTGHPRYELAPCSNTSRPGAVPSIRREAPYLFTATDRNRETTNERFDYHRCQCGFIFLRNQPAILEDYYPDSYHPPVGGIEDLQQFAAGEQYKVDIVEGRLDGEGSRCRRLLGGLCACSERRRLRRNRHGDECRLLRVSRIRRGRRRRAIHRYGLRGPPRPVQGHHDVARGRAPADSHRGRPVIGEKRRSGRRPGGRDTEPRGNAIPSVAFAVDARRRAPSHGAPFVAGPGSRAGGRRVQARPCDDDGSRQRGLRHLRMVDVARSPDQVAPRKRGAAPGGSSHRPTRPADERRGAVAAATRPFSSARAPSEPLDPATNQEPPAA